jgi:hypothetical protein
MTMMNDVEKALQTASTHGFWGQIQIDYQDGEPVVIRLIQTTNLKKAEDNRRHEARRNKQNNF